MSLIICLNELSNSTVVNSAASDDSGGNDSIIWLAWGIQVNYISPSNAE